MWMSETPSLCASTTMLLSRRTSELSLCSIGLSSSPAESLEALLLERLDELVGRRRRGRGGGGEVGLVGDRRRQVVGRARLAARADLVVGGVQGGVDGAAEDGDHLQLGIELDLVDGGASRRVLEGDDEPAVADQQRHRAQARGDAVAELAQRLGLDRERLEVDQRIAHLAGERGLQLVARDHAHPHQDLAERDAAVELLLHERFLQLAVVDHAEREQRLADPNQRHLLLALDRLEQLLRG